MEPQGVHTEPKQAEAKEDKWEGEPESAAASRPPDSSSGDPDPGAAAGSSTHRSPPLHNGTELQNHLLIRGGKESVTTVTK